MANQVVYVMNPHIKFSNSTNNRNLDAKIGVRNWTDAYLATFAQQAHLRMVSFDKGFARYADLALLSL